MYEKDKTEKGILGKKTKVCKKKRRSLACYQEEKNLNPVPSDLYIYFALE